MSTHIICKTSANLKAGENMMEIATKIINVLSLRNKVFPMW